MKRKARKAKPTLAALRRELRALRDPERAANLRWFFKAEPGGYGDGDRFLGTRMPALRTLVRKYAVLSRSDVEKLLASAYHEERMLALLILVRQYERGDDATRAAVYRMYMNALSRVNNWDLVDSSAPQIVGEHLRDRDRGVLRKLARSENLWERRIGIVGMGSLESGVGAFGSKRLGGTGVVGSVGARGRRQSHPNPQPIGARPRGCCTAARRMSAKDAFSQWR